MHPRYLVNDESYELAPQRIAGEQTLVTIDDSDHRISLYWFDDHQAELVINNESHLVFIAQDEDKLFIHLNGRTHTIERLNDFSGSSALQDVDGIITAPMPGAVLTIHVKAGEPVTNDQVLMVIESMKMQLEIKSNTDGIAQAINYEVGQTFDRGALLVEIETEETCEE